MKINLALIVAVFLGLAAALLNWLYLNKKSEEAEKVAFLGIAPGAVIRRGEVFKEEHFAQVEIPASSARNMKNYVELYSALDTVKNTRATRTYTGGDLVHLEDLKTPAAEIDLRKDEQAIFVTVDTRSFVPSLVTPGDYVSFVVTNAPSVPVAPRSDDSDPAAETAPVAPLKQSKVIGPFRVLSIGNRLGGNDVFSAAGRSPQQENVMTVAANAPGGVLEPKAVTLFELMQTGGIRSAGVVWHGKKKEQ